MARHVTVGQTAPDCELTDVQNRTVRLSDYQSQRWWGGWPERVL